MEKFQVFVVSIIEKQRTQFTKQKVNFKVPRTSPDTDKESDMNCKMLKACIKFDQHDVIKNRSTIYNNYLINRINRCITIFDKATHFLLIK